MNISKTDIKNYYSNHIYNRGEDYFKKYRFLVTGKGDIHREIEINGKPFIETYVIGSDRYTVRFPIFKGKLTKKSLQGATCSCMHYFLDDRECKHIVAALLSYEEETANADTNQAKPSNYYGKSLLQTFSKSELSKDYKGEMQLKPKFHDLNSDYPHISFSVGKKKMYVVKKIDDFLTRIEKNEEFSYGKELKFPHYLSQFDQKSQKLIQIISSINNQHTEHRYYSSSSSHLSNNGRSIYMDGNSFKLFFDLYQGELLESDQKDTPDILLDYGDPQITAILTKAQQGASLKFTATSTIQFYGNEAQLYTYQNNIFHHCSPEFTEKMHNLLPYLSETIFVSENDLPTLCSTVLSSLEDVIEINDADDICLSFTPDDCIPCFYFDISPEASITATLKFRYGENEYSETPTAKQLSSIRRNEASEKRGQKVLLEYFTKEKNQYHLNLSIMAEDDFLTTQLEEFRNYGEIFLSSTLQGKFVETTIKPSLGISVANGLLTLDMNVGDFPLHELEDLYNSLLRKKKYHKLKDGRFLFLDGSGYEKVAEVTHMLQLSQKDLEKQQVSLPAYRGLYLDAVLDSYDLVDSKRNQAFRHMMKDFKSVADSDYQPPETLQANLRPYQVLGFQWMKTLEQYGFGGILADEMGLGKTVQVITYLLSLTDTESPSLVICPASLLLNWGDELARFAPSLKCLLILGTAKERREQIESQEGQEAQVWVSSYDLVKRDKEYYEQKKFHTCILDEAQNIKNQTTLVSKTVKNINCQQRFVLTGTPIENRLSELWNLFDFLMPGYLFKHNTFVSKLEKPIVQSGDAAAGRQLSLLVQPFIKRRLKKDVLKELPDKLEHIRKIHLSEEERKLYLAAAASVKSQAAESKNKLQILALLTHLRQLCCDPNLCFENYDGESSKLTACLELCQSMVENGHKILLFSQFTSMLDVIRSHLDQENIRHLTIEGATSKKNRAKYVKEFQNGQADVFLISLKAGGTGLNLTNADVVIHYDPWWNQAAQNQATDRAHRIGQQQHVQVYKLIAQGTIEEKILLLQEKKALLMESVLEESVDEPLSQEDIMALLE